MNERFDVIVTILELIGTAAFAASGALTAIKRRFDLFRRYNNRSDNGCGRWDNA